MPDIKLIKEDSDISNRMYYNWDAYIDGKPYDVYNIYGFIHTIGGNYGNNSLWACPRGEEPTYENLIAFDAHPVNYSISIEEVSFLNVKRDEIRADQSYKTFIRRNGKNFYSFYCNKMDYGLAKAQVLIAEINEHPISFHFINFKEQIINRKIFWNEIPAVIVGFHGNEPCRIVIKMRGKGQSSVTTDVTDVFDKRIDWFREYEYPIDSELLNLRDYIKTF